MLKCLKNTLKRAYHHLGATLKCWLTPKHWSAPGENVIFSQFCIKNLYSECNSVIGQIEKILTSKHLANYLSAGQNTQQLDHSINLK